MAVANSGSLAQLFSIPSSTGAVSSPALQQPPDPHVQALTLLRAMGVHAQGLPGLALSAVPLLSRLSELHSPHLGACGLGVVCTLPQVLRIWAWYPPQPCESAGQPGGEETGAAAAGEFPRVPPRVFFSLRKSSCSILPLHTRNGLSSHSPPLQPDQGLSGSGHHRAQL